MSEAHPVADEGGQARWRQGTPVVGGSVTDGEHTTYRRSLSHASFFSGAGGMDIGLEAAGWRTVSFSEIDPFASAVLAEHWPDVPNLGDITTLVGDERPEEAGPARHADHRGVRAADGDWTAATLWTGGFPCTDLSHAGKRAGLRNADGSLTRSGLALTFLDLVGRYRPEALLLENVTGLLSSNKGRDLGELLRQVGDLGYGWAYRVLDAQWFGVPQRRKRVFILALDLGRHPDPDSAGAVLAVSARCGRDHKAEREAWAQAAPGVDHGPLGGLIVGPVDGAFGHHGVATPQQSLYMGHYISGPVRAGGNRLTRQELDDIGSLVAVDRAPSDTGGVRAPSGVAGWLDGGAVVASTLNSGGNSGGFRPEPGEHIVTGHFATADDPLLPVGQDSHRYRAIGNGVAAPVAHWIGLRLRQYLEGTL